MCQKNAENIFREMEACQIIIESNQSKSEIFHLIENVSKNCRKYFPSNGSVSNHNWVKSIKICDFPWNQKGVKKSGIHSARIIQSSSLDTYIFWSFSVLQKLMKELKSFFFGLPSKINWSLILDSFFLKVAKNTDYEWKVRELLNAKIEGFHLLLCITFLDIHIFE